MCLLLVLLVFKHADLPVPRRHQLNRSLGVIARVRAPACETIGPCRAFSLCACFHAHPINSSRWHDCGSIRRSPATVCRRPPLPGSVSMVKGRARRAPVRPRCAREERRPQSISGPTIALRKSGLHHINSPSLGVANSTPRRTQLASLSYSGWGVQQGRTPADF